MDYSVGFDSSGVWALAGLCFFVDRTPFLWVLMCPYRVSSDSGKNLLTFLHLPGATIGNSRYEWL